MMREWEHGPFLAAGVSVPRAPVPCAVLHCFLQRSPGQPWLFLRKNARCGPSVEGIPFMPRLCVNSLLDAGAWSGVGVTLSRDLWQGCKSQRQNCPLVRGPGPTPAKATGLCHKQPRSPPLCPRQVGREGLLGGCSQQCCLRRREHDS